LIRHFYEGQKSQSSCVGQQGHKIHGVLGRAGLALSRTVHILKQCGQRSQNKAFVDTIAQRLEGRAGPHPDVGMDYCQM